MSLTKKPSKSYIDQQLIIIQNKTNEDELNRYEALLSGAKLDKEVYGQLERACDMRRKELNPISPMVESSDISDFE